MSIPDVIPYTGATVAAPALLVSSVPLRDGTIEKLRVVFPDGTTDGDAVFRFYINDVEQVADLTVPDTDDEIDVTGLSYATTEDDKGSFRIIAPMPTALPTSPINFYIYYTETHVALTGAQTVAGVKTFSSDPLIPDEAYDATAWNGVLEPPTKNAVRDQFEAEPSATRTLTNKTIDANGTGNSITNLEVADFAGSAIVTAAETITANNNDTTLPTSAAVKAYADSVAGGSVATDAIWDAKGDIAGGTGANTAARLAVGTDGQFLKADSTQATGLIWDTIPGGGDLLSTNNLSDVASAATSRTNLGVGTGDSPEFAAVNIGAATDTTVTRSSAGVIAVEGVTVPLNSTTSVHTASSIELGHASDTTITRASAGVIAVEGSNLIRAADLGANVATFLATPSSANLAGALTDETGSGVAVFATAPTISNPKLDLDASAASDDTYSGVTISGRNNSGGVTQWDAVYLNGSSEFVIADANGTNTYPAIGLAVATVAAAGATTVLTHGTVRNDAWAWTVGGVIYLSTTAGGLTQTAPSTSGDKVQVMGIAISADEMLVMPSLNYITIT